MAQIIRSGSIEDLASRNPICANKNCNRLVAENNVGSALDNPHAYIRIKELSISDPNPCPAASNDHFRVDLSCKIQTLLEGFALGSIKGCTPDTPRSIKFSGQVLILEDYELYMSPFKKLDKVGDQSDLTGDGGQLIFKALTQINRIGFEAVYDIGAQDTDFVKRFDYPLDRYVLDRNILAPFLQTQELPVKYLIGDAETLLKKDLRCLNPQPESGKRLFAMSNFFNVLEPNKGWAILKLIPQKMQADDHLAITNIHHQQFLDRNNIFLEKKNEAAKKSGEPPYTGSVPYQEGAEVSGFVPFNDDKGFYKTTIKTESFIAKFLELFRCFQVEYKNQTTLPCRVNEKSIVNVRFITIIFKRLPNKKVVSHESEAVLLPFPPKNDSTLPVLVLKN